MVSKLCCTAEQDGRSDSPDLPNARVSESTPAKLPLLHQPPSSHNSHFTSARTEELHELRQIFENAQEDATPTKQKGARARFNRPSVYSLHSLHGMKSMHSIIRRRFSKDLSKKQSPKPDKQQDAKNVSPSANDTVLKQASDGARLQLKITKEDLKKDLLSNKKPEQGGYDSDAEVLDDIAKNIGKKTSSKRPSIHSIEWSPSTATKPTPGSSSKSRHSAAHARHTPYDVTRPQSISLSARFSQVFSTPNFQHEVSKVQGRKLKRSHSATSINFTSPSLSTIRLPSIDTNEEEGVPWSVALSESLRLSHFPAPLPVTEEHSRDSLDTQVKKEIEDECPAAMSQSSQDGQRQPSTPATVVQIRVQEPTAVVTPRNSTSARETVGENVPPPSSGASIDLESQDAPNTRASVHLYSMRISHHLRSGSLLSWETLADAPDRPHPPHVLRDRSVSNLSQVSRAQRQHSRHERQTSSSGFASAKVPSKWGNVVKEDVPEDKSSLYSSRPQSPPVSFSGSLINLTHATTGDAKNSHIDVSKVRRSNSYPTDNEDTPRPAHRHGASVLHDVVSYSAIKTPSTEPLTIARKNSVASTKKSKFREEFSPSPPKKKLIPSASIMKFLNPKRSSARSQSETAAQPPNLGRAVDGMLETSTTAAAQRERRASRSRASMDLEQKALGNDKKASPMWEQALKTHQEERMAMFLPKNKQMATQSSPVRVRRGSVLRRPSSPEGEQSRTEASMHNAKQFPEPQIDPPSPIAHPGLQREPSFRARRTAFVTRSGDVSPGDAARMHFDQQTDNIETVGAWGRYPSHSRKDRTLSAGAADNVDSRDFALEAAIKFAMGQNREDYSDEIDPAQRPLTPPLLPGEKKQKKKIGHTRMTKSNSMTFGRSFLKNYTKIFRSQSIEFHQHGRGHRSSISTGGHLKYPELELVPGYWPGEPIKEGSEGQSQRPDVTRDKNKPGVGPSESDRKEYYYQSKDAAQEAYGPADNKGKGKLQEAGPSSTIRPPNTETKIGYAPVPRLDGPADERSTTDAARAWSAYYENCLPAFPRASTELDFNPRDFGKMAGLSSNSRHASMHSRTLPDRPNKHSRNGSRFSRVSVVSQASGRPSQILSNEREDGDECSVASVRRSTTDLVTTYKKQEVRERERVLSLARAESQPGGSVLAGL